MVPLSTFLRFLRAVLAINLEKLWLKVLATTPRVLGFGA